MCRVLHQTNYARVARGFTRVFPLELHGGSVIIDWLPAKETWAISETDAWFLRGIKQLLQMIRAGIPAARHIRNACMSTAPPGRIGLKSTENLKVLNPAV